MSRRDTFLGIPEPFTSISIELPESCAVETEVAHDKSVDQFFDLIEQLIEASELGNRESKIRHLTRVTGLLEQVREKLK